MLGVLSYIVTPFYKSGKKPQWQIAQSVIGAKLVFWLQLILHASSR